MKAFIIDDDSLSIYITEYTLKFAGFSENISSFMSAEAALSFLKQSISANTPEMIFLDLNMPVMNGWEFLEELKPYERELMGRCRIYILTSSLDLSDTVKWKDYQLVEGLIHKPIDKEDIDIILSQIKEEKES